MKKTPTKKTVAKKTPAKKSTKKATTKVVAKQPKPKNKLVKAKIVKGKLVKAPDLSYIDLPLEKTSVSENRPRTRTYYVRGKNGHPIGCVVYESRKVSDEIFEIRVGFSTHNPLDDWDRKLGRAIALGRMIEASPFSTFGKTTKEMFHIILTNLSISKDAPMRLTKRLQEILKK